GRVHADHASSPSAWERKKHAANCRDTLPSSRPPSHAYRVRVAQIGARESVDGREGEPVMVFIVVVAVIVLAALFMFVFVVTMQIHREERRYREERRAWEERRQWNRSLRREEIPIPLTRPAADRWAQFARSACGVYINGIGGEPAP